MEMPYKYGNQKIVESNWNTQYIKTCLPTKCYQYIILFFATHLNYGLLLWGTHVNRVLKLQKKTVRIMSNSEYLAHSEPLFKTLKLLKFEDIS